MTENVARQSEIARKFIQEILLGDGDKQEKAYRVLTARGFLLERNESHLWMSDNSHEEDAGFLNERLRETGTGEVVNGEVHLSPDSNLENLLAIYKIYGGSEAFALPHWYEWINFKNRIHGPKVPVSYLDPFIARLTKSVNAIGLGTCSACDGHGANEASVSFTGDYHRTWFQVILDLYVEPSQHLSCNWFRKSLPHRVDPFISHPRNDVLSLYKEIQTVADLLYTNRETLRDVKQKVASEIHPQITDALPLEDLFKLMRERASIYLG